MLLSTFPCTPWPFQLPHKACIFCSTKVTIFPVHKEKHVPHENVETTVNLHSESFNVMYLSES